MSNTSVQMGVRTGAQADLQPGGQGASFASPQDADSAAIERFDQILSAALPASPESLRRRHCPAHSRSCTGRTFRGKRPWAVITSKPSNSCLRPLASR